MIRSVRTGTAWCLSYMPVYEIWSLFLQFTKCCIYSLNVNPPASSQFVPCSCLYIYKTFRQMFSLLQLGGIWLSLSLPTADISAVWGSWHYSWASWSRGFVYFLANGVRVAECSKQFFNKFWVVFQADFCVLWVKSCSVRQDGVQKVYCWRSSQNFVRIAEQRRH